RFSFFFFFFFFFQAEDGIRDKLVTGVQTCALPISEPGRGALFLGLAAPEAVLPVLARPVAAFPYDGTRPAHGAGLALAQHAGLRSEERRVGKEGRGRGSPDN